MGKSSEARGEASISHVTNRTVLERNVSLGARAPIRAGQIRPVLMIIGTIIGTVLDGGAGAILRRMKTGTP
jgi:hypothetical protein